MSVANDFETDVKEGSLVIPKNLLLCLKKFGGWALLGLTEKLPQPDKEQHQRAESLTVIHEKPVKEIKKIKSFQKKEGFVQDSVNLGEWTVCLNKICYPREHANINVVIYVPSCGKYLMDFSYAEMDRFVEKLEEIFS